MSKALRATVSSLDAAAAAAEHGGVESGEAETDVSDHTGELLITQTQELTNAFRVPITLYSASMDDPRFSVIDFQPGVKIEPNETYYGIVVQYKGPPDATITRLRLSLQSSVAKEFAVPIWTFHGRLTLSKTDGDAWERFGNALPSLYSELSLRGVISKETVVCEANCVVQMRGLQNILPLPHGHDVT